MLNRIIICLLVGWSLQGATRGQGPKNVLLVVNELSQDSKAIGDYYILKRSLPDDHVCRIRTAPSESIGRGVYEREILAPVADCLRGRSLQDQILYIVTTKGVPLIVQGDAGPLGDLASVDSELTLLYRSIAYGPQSPFGRIENPYFGPAFDPARPRPFVRSENETYLVTRLTGFSVIDVVFLIDRGVHPTGEGGFHFDLPSSRESAAAEWVTEAASKLEAAGFKTEVEESALVLDHLKEVAGYWSAGAEDPNFNPSPEIEWVPGAVGAVLDSSSASTFTPSADDKPSPASLGAQLVHSGITGFGGQVANPSLDGQIRPQILFQAYTSGLNLAESFYQGIRYLSWRAVVVGDPLTSPFAAKLERPTTSAPELDAQTGLPAELSQRRATYLIQKYSTTAAAITPFLKAEGLCDQGRYSEALPFLQESLQADSGIVETHLLAGEALDRTGDFPEAFRHLEKAVELGDSDPRTRERLAIIAKDELKSPGKAVPHARWLLARFGATRPDYTLLYADLQFQLGNLKEAEAYYASLVKEGQKTPVEALAGLARIQHRQENCGLAQGFLGEALSRFADKDTPPTGSLEALRIELQGLLDDCAVKLKAGNGASVEAQEEKLEGEEAPDVTPAKALSRVLPKYPQEAQTLGVEGVVVLRLLIDEHGQLLKIVRVTGDKTLAKAFEKAVRQWTFSPRLVRGKPEPSWLNVPLRFRLSKKQ